MKSIMENVVGLVPHTYNFSKGKKKYSIILLKKQAKEFLKIYMKLGFDKKIKITKSNEAELINENIRYGGRATRFSDVKGGLYELTKKTGRKEKIFLNQWQSYVLFNHIFELGIKEMRLERGCSCSL